MTATARSRPLATTPSGRRRRLRNLPLFWKLLLPFLVLITFLGAAGGWLIVRDLSERARTELDRELLRRSLEARSLLRDRELYMLEAANFAANIENMARSIARRDANGVVARLRSVVALKTELDLVLVTDGRGREIARIDRAGRIVHASAPPSAEAGRLLADALASADGERASGLIRFDGRGVVAVAAPVCSDRPRCRAAGVAFVVMDVHRLAEDALAASRETEGGGLTGVALYDAERRLAAAAGLGMPGLPPSTADGAIARRTGEIASEEVAALYLPFPLRGRSVGTLAVSVPTAPAFASVRDAGLRLALILIAAAVGIVAIGLVLSRLILAQVRPLVAASRALGRGELNVRAPVLTDDELGELARHFNEMAAELQASQEGLEARVAERTERIERLLRERTDFFTGISHELRTPLAVILGRTKMMLSPRYRRAGKSAAQELATIRESGEQLLQLVNRLLDLARAEAGRVELDLATFSFKRFAGELKGSLEELAAAHGLRLTVDVPRDLPPVRADPERLRQVVLNLVDNAVKYTPRGGRVEVSAAQVDGVIRLTVADTGVGIPEEVGDRIFEPFYRAPGVRTQHGEPASGLGLALARKLLEAHGGTLEYEARPGGGTVFTARVPRAANGDNQRLDERASTHATG